jgi:phospholipid transport system substrate-binding protein
LPRRPLKLGIADGLYKVQDIAIDNVSMALSYRSEIASTLESHGGQLGTLLTEMRE